jgi:hypothetical protein
VVAAGYIADLNSIVVVVAVFEAYATVVCYLSAGLETFEAILQTELESASWRIG